MSDDTAEVHGRSHTTMGLQDGRPLVANYCLCGFKTGWHDHATRADAALDAHIAEMGKHPALRAFWSTQDPFAVLMPEKGIAKVLRWAADEIDPSGSNFDGTVRFLRRNADELDPPASTEQPTAG